MHLAARTRERKAVDKPHGLIVEARSVTVFAVVELALRTTTETNTFSPLILEQEEIS